MSKINETNYPRRTQANYADTDMLVIQAAGGNTYTTRLEDMREDYEETLSPTLSALQDDVNENLATIEAGSTASQAYAKGDFLVFGGRLCKAKTSIAVNATLVLDTNIELASVGDELSSISSDLTPDLLTSPFTWDATKVSINASATYAYRVGNLVFMSFDITTYSGQSGNLTVGSISLPPKKFIYNTAYDWSAKSVAPVRITSGDGNILIYNATANTEYTMFLCFPI